MHARINFHGYHYLNIIFWRSGDQTAPLKRYVCRWKNIIFENINFRQEMLSNTLAPSLFLPLIQPTCTELRLKRTIHHSDIPALLRPVIYRSAKRGMRLCEVLNYCCHVGASRCIALFLRCNLRRETRAPAERIASSASF